MEHKRVQVPLVCHGHSRPIVDLSYSPVTEDGFFLISASKDGQPMLRNGETGDWVGTFQGHKGAVWSACLDKLALRAATASADFTACLWDALTGDLLHSFAHRHIVRTTEFSQDSKRLVTGGAEKLLRIYDLARPEADPTVLTGDEWIRCATWHDNDNLILTSFVDSVGVKMWDVRSHQVVQTLDTKSSCTSVEVSRDGKFLTTADGTEVKFWDTNGFGLVKSFEIPLGAESASFFPLINRFVAGGSDLWVRLYDFESGMELECHRGHHGPVHCIRFSPGGESYASGSEDGTIRIWRTSTEENVESVANGVSASLATNRGAAVSKVGVEDVVKKVEGFHISSQTAPALGSN